MQFSVYWPVLNGTELRGISLEVNEGRELRRLRIVGRISQLWNGLSSSAGGR